MYPFLNRDLKSVPREGSALYDRQRHRPANGGDEIAGSVTNPATHALAVRQVHGEILHGVAGFSGVIGSLSAADDLTAAAALGGPIPAQLRLPDGSGPSSGFGDGHFWFGRLQATLWTCHVSAVRLHAIFYGAGGVPVAASAATGSVTVVPYRVEANGNITRGAPIVIGGAGAATEGRDAEVAGRHTFYHVSAVALGGASSVNIFVAGEGGGLVRVSTP